jgi:hypothetical protein
VCKLGFFWYDWARLKRAFREVWGLNKTMQTFIYLFIYSFLFKSHMLQVVINFQVAIFCETRLIDLVSSFVSSISVK